MYGFPLSKARKSRAPSHLIGCALRYSSHLYWWHMGKYRRPADRVAVCLELTGHLLCLRRLLRRFCEVLEFLYTDTVRMYLSKQQFI
jgi:hypothetical protein